MFTEIYKWNDVLLVYFKTTGIIIILLKKCIHIRADIHLYKSKVLIMSLTVCFLSNLAHPST